MDIGAKCSSSSSSKQNKVSEVQIGDVKCKEQHVQTEVSGYPTLIGLEGALCFSPVFSLFYIEYRI